MTSASLLIAFHFPPMSESSGLQRILGFARYLPDYGWNPVVLAPKPYAYPSCNAEQLKLTPEETTVIRSFCLDTARHLSIAGRYPRALAIPDRWVTWIPSAVISGLRAIRRYRPTLLWSTYPIATAHIIGRTLSRVSGLPWVADFRDPMVELNPRTGLYAPSDPALRRSRLRVEKMCVEGAAALVFCTPAARDICIERYGDLAARKSVVISNGYEESAFEAAEQLLHRGGSTDASRPLYLLHSGTIYPTPDRDPTAFFDALSLLKVRNRVSSSTVRVVLRATGHDSLFEKMLAERGISDLVELAPPLPYLQALAEMMSADGLLLFQGYPSNPAIPVKLYEYLRARRPILAMVDAEGSTAKLLAEIGVGTTVSIESASDIHNGLLRFIASIQKHEYDSASPEYLTAYRRSALTGHLAELFACVSSRT